MAKKKTIAKKASTKKSAVKNRTTNKPAAKKSAKKPAPKKTTSGGRGGWTWAPAKPVPSSTVYQFRITLLGIHPPIWRRIQVRDCFLDEFHRHIQGAMGWTDCHHYLFDIDPVIYGRAFEYDSDGQYVVVSASKTLLRTVIPTSQPGFSFRYTYDLGDGWEHLIAFERTFEPTPKARYPLCVEGARSCPPDNCGGVPGYEHFLDVLHDPDDEEYDELLECVGGNFDPEHFDPKRATRAMTRSKAGRS